LVRRRRRADVVLRDICGPFSQGCRVRRQNSQRCSARRFTGRATNSFPTGHQYENRQGAWHYCASDAPRPRRRGDRMIRRREFITLLGGAAAVWPVAARAQQPDRMRRIVVLSGIAHDQEAEARIASFLKGLAELGWIEGRNVRIEYRWAGG